MVQGSGSSSNSGNPWQFGRINFLNYHRSAGAGGTSEGEFEARLPLEADIDGTWKSHGHVKWKWRWPPQPVETVASRENVHRKVH